MISEPIKIAILAMGGEGGGVLADWIVDLAEHSGWFAQTTSVPGVAQRTGATIYYVEVFPGADQPGARRPILAQSPMPGDVDIVLASELMEAGRAVVRGFVTRARTTLITSTHRVYAIAEKSTMGDGRVDSEALLRQAQRAAREIIAFDMAEMALRMRTVVSSLLFGALGGCGALPFSRAEFEATIERSGLAVEVTKRAFAAAFDTAREIHIEASQPGIEGLVSRLPVHESRLRDPASVHPKDSRVAALVEHVLHHYPQVAQAFAVEGIRRCVDYQDPAYGRLYLDRLDRAMAAPGGSDPDLVAELARHLALWMSYEDTMRVADLKVRGSRFERVRSEVRAEDRIFSIAEYMHPRVEEICDTLPAPIGRWLLKPNLAHRFIERFCKGRVIKTSSLRGFLPLYVISKWGRWRRITLRYAVETERIESWLRRVAAAAAIDPRLGLEAAKCQMLVRGYSNTHFRGMTNYEIIMHVLDRHLHELAPAALRELRNAAMADEFGRHLRSAIERHGFSTEGLFPPAVRIAVAP